MPLDLDALTATKMASLEGTLKAKKEIAVVL